MAETLSHTAPLTRWQGEKATYHLVTFTGEAAEALSAQAVMDRLEFGTRRGFGSVKVMARIGDTEWKTSVFPQRPRDDTPATRNISGVNPDGRVEGAGGPEPQRKHWILLVSKKVMRAEDLCAGDQISVAVSPI